MSIAKKRTKVIDLLNYTDFGKEVTVMGWVRSRRGNKYVQFMHVNDGSIIHNFQVVFDLNKFSEQDLKGLTTGACVAVTGPLVQSQGKGQAVEMQAASFEIFGTCETEEFPLQKRGEKDKSGKVIGGPSLDTLREIAHLRPRTNTFGAVFRIRHALAFAIHKYFNDRGFFYLHTPIITGSDAEGAGEMFRVTTLDAANPPRSTGGTVDFSRDFFGKETHLTVSGQLEGELGALALGLIYTFGPTFRAENSNTPRHLAEFWMIEPEMAFFDLEDNMDLAEDFLKYLIRYALENCAHDLEFLSSMYDKELLNRLKSVISQPFERLPYTQAIEVLKNSGKKFEFGVEWGTDLQKEQAGHSDQLSEGDQIILHEN
jgi:asparaginyl-tRNA synthetase